MKRWSIAALLTLTLLLAPAHAALACDPYWDWWCDDFSYWYEPPAYEPVTYEAPAYDSWDSFVWYEPPVPEPALPEPVVWQPWYEPPSAPQITYEYVAPEPPPPAAPPAPEPIPVWTSPIVDTLTPEPPAALAQPVAPPPAPGALAAEMGLHAVEIVWAGDLVTQEGPITTYTTSTVQQHPGTYATIVASVATGETSAYDALVFNGRMTLSDGRPVKGDVYANYVWDGYGFVIDRYVFFQDDLEVARLNAPIPSPPPTPIAIPGPVPLPAATGAVIPAIGPVPTAAPTATPVAPQAAAPSPPSGSGPLPQSPTGSMPRVARDVSAGVALAPQGDPLGRIEVLRGRRVHLWIRATVDRAPATVISWRLVAGEVTAIGAVSGSGDEPLVAMWEALPPRGAAFTVRFAVTVDVPGEGSRAVDAAIDVAIRSPALVE